MFSRTLFKSVLSTRVSSARTFRTTAISFEKSSGTVKWFNTTKVRSLVLGGCIWVLGMRMRAECFIAGPGPRSITHPILYC